MESIKNVHITCQKVKTSSNAYKIVIEKILSIDQVLLIGTGDFQNMLPLYLENVLMALNIQKGSNPNFPWISMSELSRLSSVPSYQFNYLRELLRVMVANGTINQSEHVPVLGSRVHFYSISSNLR